MSNFLEGYEDVNARIIRIRAEYPSLRLIAYIEDIDITKGYVLIKAEAYREYEDLVPSAVDYAYEVRSDRGVNQHFWVENAVTSAYGRVIGLLSPGGIARSTKQDMEKVEALAAKDVAPDNSDFWATNPAAAAIPTLAQAVTTLAETMGATEPGVPSCNHGPRIWRSGEKNGKAWGVYGCSEKVKANQCAPFWYMQTSTGWKPQL